MDKEYEKRKAELALEQVVEFESDVIAVDIPIDGVTVSGGWKISPLTPPRVRKYEFLYKIFI